MCAFRSIALARFDDSKPVLDIPEGMQAYPELQELKPIFVNGIVPGILHVLFDCKQYLKHLYLNIISSYDFLSPQSCVSLVSLLLLDLSEDRLLDGQKYFVFLVLKFHSLSFSQCFLFFFVRLAEVGLFSAERIEVIQSVLLFILEIRKIERVILCDLLQFYLKFWRPIKLLLFHFCHILQTQGLENLLFLNEYFFFGCVLNGIHFVLFCKLSLYLLDVSHKNVSFPGVPHQILYFFLLQEVKDGEFLFFSEYFFVIDPNWSQLFWPDIKICVN